MTNRTIVAIVALATTLAAAQNPPTPEAPPAPDAPRAAAPATPPAPVAPVPAIPTPRRAPVAAPPIDAALPALPAFPATPALPATPPAPPLGDLPVSVGLRADLDARVRLGGSHSAENSGGVISFGRLDQTGLDEMAEDLRILGYIVNETLGRPPADETTEYRLGVPLLLQSGGHPARASYIEGFGAIFTLQARIPLVAPASSETKPDSGNADSEWDKARQAIAGRSAGSRSWSQADNGERPVYNVKLVETLKRRALAALRNATNLRRLGPDEYVVVTIVGSPNHASTEVNDIIPGTETFSGNGRSPMTVQPASSRPTIMTIRVKKSAADGLKNRAITPEEFDRQAEVATYLGSAGHPQHASAGM